MLSLQQQQFVNATLAGQSVEKAAQIAGITKMTGYRWMKLEAVQMALAGEVEKRAETAREIINRVYMDQLEAVFQVVRQIALDVLAPAPARLKAIAMIQDRLAPVATTSTLPHLPEQPATPGIDWTIFNQEELAVILPIFEAAEKRAAGVIDMKKKEA